MKLILTDAQAQMVIEALENEYNDDYPETDPINAKLSRLADKIRKLRGEEPVGYLTLTDEKEMEEQLKDKTLAEKEAIFAEFNKRRKQWDTD